MPDDLPVLVNLPDSVKRNALRLALIIEQLKRGSAFRKPNFVKRHENNPVGNAVVIANLELATRKFCVPANAAEQFVNRLHDAIVAVSVSVGTDARGSHMLLLSRGASRDFKKHREASA